MEFGVDREVTVSSDFVVDVPLDEGVVGLYKCALICQVGLLSGGEKVAVFCV